MNLLFGLGSMLLIALMLVGIHATEEAKAACALRGGTTFHGRCVQIEPLQVTTPNTNKVKP